MARVRSTAAQCVLWATLLMLASVRLHAQKLRFDREARVNWDYAEPRIPTWSQGFLIPIVSNRTAAPVVHFIDDYGKEGEPLRFTIPDARFIEIVDVARGPDGTWAVSGTAHDYQGKGGGFISWVSPNRQNVTTIQTYPYIASRLSIAPDGTTWTEGIELVPDQDWTGSDHGVIRRFDRFGKMTGWWIPRNTIPEVSGNDLISGKLAVSADRVGWCPAAAHKYFELTYEGDKVSRYASYPGIAAKAGQRMVLTGLAIVDDADVYATVQDLKAATDQIYVLDRARRAWKLIEAPNLPGGTPIDHPFLYGGNGKRLALYYGPEEIVFVTPGDANE